ncbi:hypothetical protein FZC66_16960 [Priestia megaterium]|nr:hypothetical protein FZC66_16960 [Priestia megaterium]
MMTIYYSVEEECWYHRNPQHCYTWGVQSIELPFRTDHSSIQAHLRQRNDSVGPIIGLLTSKRMTSLLQKKRPALFEKLHHYLHKHGGLLLLFSPENLYKSYVYGYYFDAHSDTWIQAMCPLPNLIYNRFPNRHTEKETISPMLKKLVESCNIPFFNPHFFSKWDTYTLLSMNNQLRPYLPATRVLKEYQDIKDMLTTHTRVYMKPLNSSKGKGIFTLTLLKNNQIEYEDESHKKVYEVLENMPLPTSAYLVQEAIHTDCLKAHRYDLRLLVHRYEDTYTLSGIGVRQSKRQPITTHTLNGGVIAPFQEIKDHINLPLLEDLAILCGKQLHQHFGFVGEFSMDIGKTPNDHYYIFEINAKPMIFDETHIQEKGMENLCTLFYKLTNF